MAASSLSRKLGKAEANCRKELVSYQDDSIGCLTTRQVKL